MSHLHPLTRNNAANFSVKDNSQYFKDSLVILDYSFTEFAEHIGVSLKTVSFWANNKAPVPRPVFLYLELRLKNLRLAEQLAERNL